MFGLLPAVALALLAVDAQAMKLDFLRFPRRAVDTADTHALEKRAPTYITNFTLPDTNYTYVLSPRPFTSSFHLHRTRFQRPPSHFSLPKPFQLLYVLWSFLPYFSEHLAEMLLMPCS